MNYGTFLRWALFAILIIVGCMFAQNLGVFGEIYTKDSTGLSVVLAGMFTVGTIWAGCLSYRVDKQDRYLSEPEKVNFKRYTRVGWFMGNLCLAVGMIGTLIGFVYVLDGFAETDVSNVVETQQLLMDVGIGMSMALYTTLVGLVCGTILKIQFFNLDHTIDRVDETVPRFVLDSIETFYTEDDSSYEIKDGLSDETIQRMKDGHIVPPKFETYYTEEYKDE